MQKYFPRFFFFYNYNHHFRAKKQQKKKKRKSHHINSEEAWPTKPNQHLTRLTKLLTHSQVSIGQPTWTIWSVENSGLSLRDKLCIIAGPVMWFVIMVWLIQDMCFFYKKKFFQIFLNCFVLKYQNVLKENCSQTRSERDTLQNYGCESGFYGFCCNCFFCLFYQNNG